MGLCAISEGRMATFNTDLRVDLPCTASVATTGGLVTAEAPFWCPTAVTSNGRRTEFPLPAGAGHGFNYTNSAGLAFEAEHVRQCILVGNLSHDRFLVLTHSSLAAKQFFSSFFTQFHVFFQFLRPKNGSHVQFASCFTWKTIKAAL